MIHLIGGPPRCGKTTLASALASKSRVPYFPVDHVASVITPYVPTDRHRESFPLRIARNELNDDNDRFFEKYTSEMIVGFYLKQAETMWPGIRNFIQYAIADEHQLILEGWQLLPRFVREIADPANRPKLDIKYLVKTDIEAIRQGLKAGNPQGDWVLRNTREEETFQKIARMISHFGQLIEKEAIQYGFQVVKMDENFHDKIDSLV